MGTNSAEIFNKNFKVPLNPQAGTATGILKSLTQLSEKKNWQTLKNITL